MIQMQADPSGQFVELAFEGKLEHADYETLVPRLEAWLEEHGSIRCLVDMREFQGIETRAIWDELRFDVRHARDIERYAVVGDRRWEAWMTQLAKALFHFAEVRYFQQGEQQAARDWLGAGA